ncbi:MAG: CotS family spore coat protein [Lachnospiraceae bacterium]|nr:CotS family spore coat protein [Lachnospiraceae bacterium]
MDDKNEQIYSQYSIQIDNIYKNKGIVYLETKDGLYIIKSYNYTEKKLKTENLVKEEIERRGYENLDICVANKTDGYISYNKYMNKFIMRKWFVGDECDINNIDDMCKTSANLASLHSYMEDISVEGEDIAIIPKRNFINEYKNYIGELKRVKKYLYNKKKKNQLELDIIKSIDYYYKEMDKYLHKLEESQYETLYEESIEQNKICHGGYTHHSVLLLKDDVATINFDKMHYGVQIYDLYALLRKAMEKNNWDIEMAKDIIESYNEIRKITDAEKEILIILLGYPEKYRKLINGYYNGKKAWLSIRIYEKLNELVATEEQRQEFIKSLEDYLSHFPLVN